MTDSGRRALQWIEDPSLCVGGLLLSPDLWDEDFSLLLHQFRKLRPGSPVHLLIEEDETDPQHPALDARVRVHLGLSEPISADHLERFLARQAIAQQPSAIPRMDVLNDGAFVGVPVSDFEDCQALIFDLHLQIAGGKFIRLLNARAENPWEQLRKYRDRGLTHVYVARETLERNLLAIRLFREAIASRSSKSSGAWSEIQAAHSVRELSGLMGRLSTIQDVDATFWSRSRELLASFRAALAVDGPIPRGEQARRWIRRSLMLEHSLSTFTVAAIIGRPLQFTREDNFLHLGMAALYHDIALLDLDGDIHHEDAASRLVGKTRELYLEHPARSAHHLATTLNADPVVIQAVLFHHWRRDGSGREFRGLPRAQTVPRLAEIIGISEECSSFMARNPTLDPRSLPTEFLPRVERRFSVEILDGMRAALIQPRA
jgi:hypothetical protein